jgi:hypothetical protein
MTWCEISGLKETDYEKVMAAVFCRQPVDDRWFGPSVRMRGRTGLIEVSRHHNRNVEPINRF